MEGRSCQLLTEERWMTLLPKGPFEFWQAGFRSPSPPLMIPGRRLFTDTLKVIPSADTGLCEDWNTLSCRLLGIMCRQFKSLHTTFIEYYFCSCICSTMELNRWWIELAAHRQAHGTNVKKGKKDSHLATSGMTKKLHTTVILSSFLCTSGPVSPFCCDSVSHLQMPAPFNTHRQAVLPF